MHSIKILATIPRRKDISEQQFHDHWRHPHGTLSKKIACLRGYVQSHRLVSPLLPDTQLAYDGITALWYYSLDDALNMGKDPEHRKYNIPAEPLYVDMVEMKLTFFVEEIITSRPYVEAAEDTAEPWSPHAWSAKDKNH